MSLRSRIADLPLLVVGVLLLSTAADILPNDTIVGVGEVQLNLARLLVLLAFGAFVAAHGLRSEHWRTGYALPLLLLLAVSLYTSHKYGTYPRYRFLDRGNSLFDLRHRFTQALLYDLPFGRGKHFAISNRFANAVAGGWALNGLVSFQSGPPKVKQRHWKGWISPASHIVVFSRFFASPTLWSHVG